MTGSTTAPPMATPRVASGLIFRDARGRVLLVKPTYKEGWDVPGGYVEPGESPRLAAVREVQEELGLDMEPGRLLAVDWAPHDREGDKLLFLFDGGSVEQDQLVLQASEIGQATYHNRDRFQTLMPVRLARRIASALAVLERGGDTYLEHGQPVVPEPVGT